MEQLSLDSCSMKYSVLRSIALAIAVSTAPMTFTGASPVFAADEAPPVTGFSFTYPASLKQWPGLVSYLERRKGNALTAYAEVFPEKPDPQNDTSSYEDSTSWAVDSKLPGLVVLTADRYGFAGGAHGYGFRDFVIWDVKANAHLRLDGLFTDPDAAKAMLTPAYCKALDKERRDRPGETTSREEIFGECPDLYKDVVSYPGHVVGRKYGRIIIHLAPYVGGPYSEGAYDLAIFIPKGLKKLIKPQYRRLFPG
jgi:hypothetical protein